MDHRPIFVIAHIAGAFVKFDKIRCFWAFRVRIMWAAWAFRCTSGAKALIGLPCAARLKSCPDTKHQSSGYWEMRGFPQSFVLSKLARLLSCADSKHESSGDRRDT